MGGEDPEDTGAPGRGMGHHLHPTLSLLLIVSVTASLPSPTDVTMVAVDMNYTLQWGYTSTELKNIITFTAEYAFSEDKNNDGSYVKVCEGSGTRSCDFTHKLDFSCAYIIRVRAESGSEHSDWIYVQFTPDEDGLLGPPSQVNIEADVAMLILTVSTSVKSTVVKLQYRVRYWERQSPEQKQVKDYDNPYVSLVSLKPWTEFCVQVSVFDQNFGMSSNYTSPQCVYTKGSMSLWQMVSVVLCSIVPVGALPFIYCIFRRRCAPHKTPDCILDLPSDLPSLLEVQEDSCEVELVITPSLCLHSSQCPLLEQHGTSRIQAMSTHCWSDSFERG
ncbi:interferon alpha/beta receptor 1a-like isoform X2 [Brachyhypopomus gauderio]|uniref:interferon alpha/beta receptor 1a-like isoform X2 n=1 Tax=Brachyhypopomus gauderio TaxID=698409 RepID=UPI00404367A8